MNIVIEHACIIAMTLGTLPSVSDLSTEIAHCGGVRCLNVSWTAPPTLDIPDVDPDIWYSLTITNVTGDSSEDLVPHNCSDIVETFCIFTPNFSSPCHKYTFSVVPYNGAGKGEIYPSITDALYHGMHM